MANHRNFKVFFGIELEKSFEQRRIKMSFKSNKFIFLVISLLVATTAFGKEINIAIIDTGIDPTNDIFQDRLYIGDKKANKDHYGLDFSLHANDLGRPYDEHGHGTHIAGIVAELAPKARLHVLKYYNPNATGEQNLASTIQALEYAIKLNVDIINYSSGGPEASAKEKYLFDLANQKGIVIVSAAGNEGANIDTRGSEFFPASYTNENIITVGAHDDNYMPLKSSNFGKVSVDIFAPGKRILSSLPNNRKGYLTGTSQATAFVSARVSQIMKNLGTKNIKIIKKQLFKNSLKKKSIFGLCQSNGALNPVSILSPIASVAK